MVSFLCKKTIKLANKNHKKKHAANWQLPFSQAPTGDRARWANENVIKCHQMHHSIQS
jgi:hypothetical protein